MNNQNTKIKALIHNYNIRRYIILIAILIMMMIVFSTRSSKYVSLANFRNIFWQYSEIGMIAVGMTLTIITGNIDLSVGSIFCFCGFIVGILMQTGMPIPMAVVLALLCGSGIGALNGIIISKMKMQAIITTLGTMTAFRGLSYVVKSGDAIRNFPDERFYSFGAGTWCTYLPYSFLVMLLLFIVVGFLMKKTELGMNLIAMGNGITAAKYSGIRTDLCIIFVYTFNGFVSALAGISMLSRLRGFEASVGKGYEFDAIMICLLGGVSIKGGKGTIFGTFLGLVVIAYLKNGMNLARIDTLYQQAILGIVVMFAVICGEIKFPLRTNKKI